MKTFIILIVVSYLDARHKCENIENEKFYFDKEPTMTDVRAKILDEDEDDELADHLSVYEISDFMDDCNDQMIDLDGFFMSYVYAEQNELDKK